MIQRNQVRNFEKKKWRYYRQIPCLHIIRIKQLNFLFPNLIIRVSQSKSMPFCPMDTNENHLCNASDLITSFGRNSMLFMFGAKHSDVVSVIRLGHI